MVLYDGNNNKDSELAEKIFEYCKNNFEWFTTDDDSCSDYGDYFVCDNGTITASGENNGLTITPTEEFIEFINKKFSPEKMEVTNIQDYSCRYIGDNNVQVYVGINGTLNNPVDNQFACGREFDFFIDDCIGYPYIQNSFKKIYPVFKNINDGKLYKSVSPIEVTVAEEEDDWIVELANGEPYVFTWNEATGSYQESDVKEIFGINYFDPEDFFEPPYTYLEDFEDEDVDWDDFELVELREEDFDF